jgi:sugar transferase (PEP-CTERM system associated)
MWHYLALRKLSLVFLETLLIIWCVLGAHFLHHHGFPLDAAERHAILFNAIFIAIIYQLSMHLSDIYNFRDIRPSLKYLMRICQALVLATAALCLLFYLSPGFAIDRGVFAFSLPISALFLLAWHGYLRLRLGGRIPRTNLLLLGTGDLERETAREILRHPELGIKVVGFVDDKPELVGVSIVNPKVIGLYQDLPRVVANNRIDHIVVGVKDRRGKLPIKDLLDFKTRGVAIEDATTFYERVAGKIPVDNLKPSWMVFNSGFNVSKRILLQKRILALFVSAILLALFSPLILLLMILIKLDSKGPAIYRQERVGQDGRTFMLLKFRSMYENAEAKTGPVWCKEGDPRVTRIGRLMRRTRLDELPQFYNIFRGDMGMVGPRPERPHFVQQLAETIPYYHLRHVVKPGVTGWAQINYGYANTMDHTVEKLQYDLFYIKNMSWVLDALIMLETVKTVLVKKGS